MSSGTCTCSLPVVVSSWLFVDPLPTAGRHRRPSGATHGMLPHILHRRGLVTPVHIRTDPVDLRGADRHRAAQWVPDPRDPFLPDPPVHGGEGDVELLGDLRYRKQIVLT
jgi:hypothetical protein